MPFGERHPPRNEWTAPRGEWAYRVSRGIVWCLLAGFIRRRLHGFENVVALRRQRGAFLLVSNHISHFDGPILTMTAPGAIDWLTAAEFFRPGGLGIWMRKSGGLPVPRGVNALRAVREAIRRLRRGRVLGIFPEGGLRAGARSVLEGAPTLRGAAWLARRERVPVVPCVILGTDRLYAARHWRPWRGRVPVWIGFGPVIRPEEWADASSDLLGERLRALYTEMQQVFRLQSDDLPRTAQERQRQS